MNKARIIIFAAEILAVAVLRLTFMLRRDNAMPKGSKVPWIKGKPVVNGFFKPKPNKPFRVGTWTAPTRGPRMPATPDTPPDA